MSALDREFSALTDYITIVSAPEKCGLSIVATLEDSASLHSFNTFLVVRDDEGDGSLYFAYDSGCSCPLPFEDVKRLSDLMRLESVQQLSEALGAFCPDLARARYLPDDRRRFLSAVGAALGGSE